MGKIRRKITVLVNGEPVKALESTGPTTALTAYRAADEAVKEEEKKRPGAKVTAKVEEKK